MEKRVSILLVCFAISALAISTTSQAANLLVDPGAEGAVTSPTGNGENGWTFGNGGTKVFSTNFAHTGTNSIELAGAGGFGVPLVYQTFNGVSGGQNYTMTGFGLTPTQITGSGAADFGGLQVTFFSLPDGGGSNLGTVQTAPGTALFSQQINTSSPTGVWIPLNLTATAPAGAQSVQAFAIVIDQTPTTVYFDDMTLTVPEPSTVVLALTGLVGLVAFAKKRRV